MPKNNSMRTRTKASLIPTSNFQIARTNFISKSRIICSKTASRRTLRGPNLFDGRPYSYPADAVDSAANISTAPAVRPWRAEVRSTLALAWPLILANLTQQLIQATDILLMGRLGATQL